MDSTELDLLHTVIPTPTAQMEPVQPIDALLDDIMTGLHFLPSAENQTNQHGFMSITSTSSGAPISKAMYPNSHSIKPTDPKQHLEGELGDILDHFLRTFDQQVGCCGLDLGNETLQDKFDASSDKLDPSTDPWSNTPKIHTQLQPHNLHLHHQKPQADLLHTSSTLSTQSQVTATVSPSVAEKTNAQDGQIRRSEEEKPSTDQNIAQQFENRRLTRSQSMKRKLEMAFISLQNPVKRKCKEKQSADPKKKRQRDNRGQSKPRANKSGVNNMDTQSLSEERQKQPNARKRRCGVKKFGRKKRCDENRSHQMDGFYERKKSPRKGSPGTNGCGAMKKKKNVGEDHAGAESISKGFQAGQPSVKRQIGGTCIEIASSAMEKVRMFLQLQDEKEDERANEIVGIHRENKVGNRRVVNHKSISGAAEKHPVVNSLQGNLGESQELEDVGRIVVNREVEAQEKINSMLEVSQRQEDDKRMADGLRQEDLTNEECSVPFQLNLPVDAGKRSYCLSRRTFNTYCKFYQKRKL